MRGAAVMGLLGLLATASGGVHAEACKSTCTEELRSCRAGCAGSPRTERRACIERCREQSTCTAPGSRLRLGAVVVNDCTTDAAGITTFKQKLVARRGNCDFVTIKELPAVGPLPDPLIRTPVAASVCALYGDFRIGSGSLLFGRFQRLTALPDASGVVFEVTSHLSSLAPMTPALPDEGIFFARPDGSRLRRLGDASRVFVFRADLDPGSPVGISFSSVDKGTFGTSPNGRLITFVDRVADESGAEANQVFVLDIASTERTQVTHLPPSSSDRGACCAGFADDRTIVFVPQGGFSGQRARVKVDGSGYELVDIDIAGGTVQPQFGVVGSGFARLFGVGLPNVVPAKTFPGATVVNEVFFLSGRQLLQITALRHPDTGAFAFGGGRIFVASSANPPELNTNPTGTCQLFSYDTLGGHLRQLTHFHDEGRTNLGCIGGAPGATCVFSGGGSQDPQTGFLAFGSQCDPFGRNPYGEQIFSIRPDGTGLRQITAWRGREVLPDGGVHVELQGPAAQAVRY